MSAEAQRLYRQRHPERVKAQKRRIRVRMSPAERHIVGFVARSNRRAKAYGLPDRLRAQDVRQLVIGPCVYCGGLADTWDHVVALRAGGANHVDNLVSACAQCNRSKPQPWQRVTRPAIARSSWARYSPQERHERIHTALFARNGRFVACKHCAGLA